MLISQARRTMFLQSMPRGAACLPVLREKMLVSDVRHASVSTLILKNYYLSHLKHKSALNMRQFCMQDRNQLYEPMSNLRQLCTSTNTDISKSRQICTNTSTLSCKLLCMANAKQLSTGTNTLNYCKQLFMANAKQLSTSSTITNTLKDKSNLRQMNTNNYTQNYKPVCMSNSRQLCTSCVRQKVVPKNLKGRKKSSQDWLTRQLNDPYVKLKQHKQYRARSAFKLSEVNDRHKILRAGQVVVDCGAAPGAWTQVAVEAVNSLPKNTKDPQGLVVAVDLLAIHPLPGATLLGGHNFTFPATQQAILDLLKDRKIDVVLSDMAPNASGTKALDHESIIELAYSALRFAVQNSAVGGTFLCKIWDGYKEDEFLGAVQRYYQAVKIVKPPASRVDSSEKFVLATQFIGLEKL